MATHFGRFVTGKHFPKLFLLLYIVFMTAVACETERAVRVLAGGEYSWLIYLLFLLAAVFVIKKGDSGKLGTKKIYKKVKGVVSCFFIFYLCGFLGWKLICILVPIEDRLAAIGMLLMALLAGMLVVTGFLYAKVIRVKRYDIVLGNIGKEYWIALVSDIHLGVFVGKAYVKKMVEKINALHPHTVAIAGDLFDTDNALLKCPEALEEISREFRNLKTAEGVYASVGNHDPKTDNETFRKWLQASGITLLDNDMVELEAVNLIGRTDGANHHREEYLHFEGRGNNKKPVVVLDHDPQNIPDDIQMGAALVLSGHTHRGQMFPVNLFTKWANGKDFFYGHRQYQNAHSIIISGVGYFELPVRLGTSNEIVELRILL